MADSGPEKLRFSPITSRTAYRGPYGGGVTKAILTPRTIGFVAAIVAGFGLWRFTSGDWLGGIVFTAVVGSLSLWYWLHARRPRDTRRY
jgi:hypothetical protein